MEKKFSEFTLDNSPAFIDQIVGLKGGDNSRTTLQSIYDLFQSVIGDVDPLPSGTYAKVMYYGGTNWGASNEFVTDGTAVTIGQATPDATAQLSVRDEGGSPKDYTTASINSNGSNVHTKHGISFFTQNGAVDNINQSSHIGQYRAYFSDGDTIFKGSDILIDKDSSNAIRFGVFDAITGNFTESAHMIYQSNALSSKSKTFQRYDDNDIKYDEYTRDGNNRTYNALFYSIQQWHDTTIAQSGGIYLSANAITSTPPDSSIRSSLHIGGAASGKTNLMSVSLDDNIASHDDTQIVLKIGTDGKIYGRFPTVAGNTPSGALLQLYNDGGVLKLG